MLLVLWIAVKDPYYQLMTKERKNIIKWVCLLHNIGKISKPTIFGKDYIYPFNSAGLVLKIMHRLNIIELDDDDFDKANDFKEV